MCANVVCGFIPCAALTGQSAVFSTQNARCPDFLSRFFDGALAGGCANQLWAGRHDTQQCHCKWHQHIVDPRGVLFAGIVVGVEYVFWLDDVIRVNALHVAPKGTLWIMRRDDQGFFQAQCFSDVDADEADVLSAIPCERTLGQQEIERWERHFVDLPVFWWRDVLGDLNKLGWHIPPWEIVAFRSQGNKPHQHTRIYPCRIEHGSIVSCEEVQPDHITHQVKRVRGTREFVDAVAELRVLGVEVPEL